MRRVQALKLASLPALLVLLAPATAEAEELRYNVAVDVTAIGVGGAAWLTSEALKKDLAPSSCRLCATNGFDTGVRDGLRWSNPDGAMTASNVLGFALVPALALGGDAIAALHDDRGKSFGVDALVIVEAGVLSADLNQLTKFLVGRQRPCARFPDPAHACSGGGADDNVSFYSGHTSVTMALAVASSEVATLRGYSWAPMLWATLPALSLFTGYLRIAADEHWATDVLSGAVIGAAVGFAAPYLLHRSVSSSGGGTTASASLRFAPLGVAGVF